MPATAPNTDETRRLFSPGSTIFEEGEQGNCAYIVERGKVDIVTWRAGEKITLATRGPGEIFGEMAIIENKPRTATAVAVDPVVLMVVTSEQLLNHIDRADPIIKMLISVILERNRDNMRKFRAAGGLVVPESPLLEQLAARPDNTIRHEAAIQKIRLEREIKEAIEQRQFELYYQPVISFKTMEVAGFEALIRWHHPDRGLVGPVHFIPVAEDSSLIVQIGRWAFDESCKALLRLRTARPAREEALFITVNVSGREFTEPEFLRAIDATLAAHAINPADITLEITESMLVSDPEVAAARLAECSNRGLIVALDDFGTGYSSLSYLHRFPIDKLKVDQSFVRRMIDDKGSREIVRSIIGLARGLDMAVIAEGIETKAQVELLATLSCDYGQGYLFGKPMIESDAMALLRKTDLSWKV